MSELNFSDQINSLPDEILTFAKQVWVMGGHTWVVGGAVRDWVMGTPTNHDIDLEVTGVPVGAFESMDGWKIEPAGHRFGVWLVSAPGVTAFEVALPQRRERFAPGHQGERAIIDTNLNIRKSVERRELTINAMAVNVLGDGSIIDPFGGLDDIAAGILRAVNTRNFGDDPLRVMRAMQFAARFNMVADIHTVAACFDNMNGFFTLSADRIRNEWVKWARAPFPAAGIRFLRACGWVEHFQHLGAINGLEQDDTWHPEGDVLEHTILALDEIANVCDPVVTWAVLLHDIGKAQTTVFEDEVDQDGVWAGWASITSPGHAEAGSEMVVDFFRSAGWDINRQVPEFIQAVQAIVGQHMRHVSWEDTPSPRAVRRMAVDVAPGTVRQWATVCIADQMGRGDAAGDVDIIMDAAECAADMDIMDAGPDQIVMGRHCMQAGMVPGVEMGDMIRDAFQAQVDGKFSDVDGGVQWVVDHM